MNACVSIKSAKTTLLPAAAVDEVGARVGIRAVGANVEIEVSVETEGGQLDPGGQANVAGQDRLDHIVTRG
jgi:hypothetical protein